MANSLADIMPKLLAKGVKTLRQNSIMAMLVNRSYDAVAAQKGSVINIPVPSAVSVTDVTPAAYAPAGTNMSPTVVQMSMNYWKEAAFNMTDKDIVELGTTDLLPMEANEAIKALANFIDVTILTNAYKKIANYIGTAGTTPFSSDTTPGIVTEARKVLNKNLAPMDDRFCVWNPDAEAAALNIRAFQDTSWSSENRTIVKGEIGERLGFKHFMDQNLPSHTTGAAASYLINGTMTLASQTLTIDGGTGAFLVGDVITIAGDTTTYVVTATTGSSPTSLSIYPGLQAVPADNAAITKKASHALNLACHRDCIAFASRPLADTVIEELKSQTYIGSIVDPISKIVLRLEVRREYKQTRWAYDILFGTEVIRPELGVRIAG